MCVDCSLMFLLQSVLKLCLWDPCFYQNVSQAHKHTCTNQPCRPSGMSYIIWILVSSQRLLDNSKFPCRFRCPLCP